MPKNQFFAYLSLSMILILMIGCAIRNDSEEVYAFTWDMSVENHTGMANDHFSKDGKHRGMSTFHWQSQQVYEGINQLVKNNIECVALIPFLYQKTDTTKVVFWKGEDGEWSHYDSMYINVSEKLHARNMHVMFKPHLWMSEGWRSNIKMENEEEWDIWFDSYERHMLHYALLAEHMKADLYCIGTEFRSSVIQQPERWQGLIRKIKEIYKGKLTYAANWDDDYDDIKFWKDMDYIGIQAYYPLTNKNNPSLGEIKDGWQSHIKKLKQLSQKHNKPILFSEIGYRSDESATIEPWAWGEALDKETNLASNTTQNLAYEALFQQLWNEDWFAGMYFWQWHNSSEECNEHERMEFTPRYKPAENTMAKWYSRPFIEESN